MLFLTEAVFHLKNLIKETTSLVAWKTGGHLGWLVLGLKKILENLFLMPSEEKKHLLLQVQESWLDFLVDLIWTSSPSVTKI